MELNALRAAFRGISVYKPLTGTPVGRSAACLLDQLHDKQGEDALESYTDLFFFLRQEGFEGLGDWLWDYLRYTENSYSRLVRSGGSDPALENAARRDVETLVLLAETDCDRYIDAMKALLPQEYATVLAGLPRWRASAPFGFDTLTAFYRERGAGLFARYRAFLWEGARLHSRPVGTGTGVVQRLRDGRLIPVEHPDCRAPEQLLGYELQREQVIANTRALVEGHRVNNVLLFGDSGTGKSATVKALIAMPEFDNLRLIEVQKEGLADMPQLIRTLRDRPEKFILFIDDLAFDQDDKTYSALKTILEGGLEPRPANVAVYATSNRRHLVRQTFSDRAGDEVDTFETISEKTALADRFGLRIPYLGMGKKEYLALVDLLCAQAGVEMDAEELHRRAMEWDVRHGGRSPRTAEQFVASLAAG